MTRKTTKSTAPSKVRGNGNSPASTRAKKAENGSHAKAVARGNGDPHTADSAADAPKNGRSRAGVIELEGSPIDARNALNDLTGAEWLPETKSFYFQKGLGSKHPHAQIEREHPAPFSYQDVQRLIAFFTKKGGRVLDPFSGVASTAKACALLGRSSTGIELSAHWHALGKSRLSIEVSEEGSRLQELIQGDARVRIKELAADSYDFIVTSPPYWSILNKAPDHKARERADQNLALRYSEDEADLGNVADYDAFLAELADVFRECGRVLKPKAYMAIIVADFRHRSRFYAFHADLLRHLDQADVAPKHRLTLQGIKALIQNHKSLKPYGYPFAYVENIHHHHILIFQKCLRRG